MSDWLDHLDIDLLRAWANHELPTEVMHDHIVEVCGGLETKFTASGNFALIQVGCLSISQSFWRGRGWLHLDYFQRQPLLRHVVTLGPDEITRERLHEISRECQQASKEDSR